MIHPIAGRCKLCKTDLATLRGNRPAAATALPSLAAMTASATRRPAVARDDESQPVLPPRTTARQLAVEPAPAWWKSWPIVVIVLATAAIIVAVVLLLWPAHKDDGKQGPPPPAPDRMDTSPLVPGGSPPSTGSGSAGSPDPWQGKVDPKSGKLPPPDPIPRVPADPDDDVLGGIVGGIGGGGGNPSMGGLGSVGMMGAMVQHACARMTTCTQADATMTMLCAQLGTTLAQGGQHVPSCAAASRCLDKLDKLDCDTRPDDFAKILGLSSDLADCVDAMQCS